MAVYLHLFETEAQFQNKRINDYYEPWASLTTESDDRVDYNKTEEEKILTTPFTIEALGSGNITWKLRTKTVQYSKNGGSWGTMNSATTIPVVAGDEVRFKGTNTNYSGNTISATTQFNVKGNIMSLTDGDEFYTAVTVNVNGFSALFSRCKYLVSASDLKLPATTLASSCYSSMFSGCTGLTTAPELPATTLADYCYDNMFFGCTSLTTAPELPATTLANYCCASMFNGCTSLTTTPELPATTLATYCYSSMFNGCTSLTTTPELPATALTSNCYQYMFAGCTGLTAAPELPATTLASNCYCYMFDSCTNLTTAPVLPATTLVNSCYYRMFYRCTKLNYVKAMFVYLNPSNATSGWLYGVASTGTFVKSTSATWTTTGADGVPTGWTVERASS